MCHAAGGLAAPRKPAAQPAPQDYIYIYGRGFRVPRGSVYLVHPRCGALSRELVPRDCKLFRRGLLLPWLCCAKLGAETFLFSGTRGEREEAFVGSDWVLWGDPVVSVGSEGLRREGATRESSRERGRDAAMRTCDVCRHGESGICGGLNFI